MSGFRAFLVDKTDHGFERRLVEREVADLPAGDVLIDVRYSSLNYKDALSATGNPGVTRNFPHTPGIDAAGLVVESSDPAFQAGDEVIVIGFDLGMNTSGGFAQRIRVPAGWIVPRPEGLSLRASMLLGTAGFTAALAVDKLLHAGAEAGSGPILVTGATGGVGSVAVMLLAKLGFEVAAVTGKAQQHDFLRSLGATRILSREDARAGADKPLLKETWGGAVDTVGGRSCSMRSRAFATAPAWPPAGSWTRRSFPLPCCRSFSAGSTCWASTRCSTRSPARRASGASWPESGASTAWSVWSSV
jgi:acrylyl-CoA reductase (NADPH)